MSTTIRIDEEVKDRLEALKREGESFNDLLDRLSRRPKDVEGMAGFLADFDDGDLAAEMAETRADLNESLSARSDE